MGATPAYGLPYPEPTGRARNGSLDVKALATATEAALAAIEAKHAVVHATLPAASSPLQNVNGAAGAEFGGHTGTADTFNFDGFNLAYVGGGTRWFDVDFECFASSPGAVTSAVSAYLMVNGVDVGRDALLTNVGGGGTLGHQTRMRVTTTVRLSDGDYLSVRLEGSEPGAIFEDNQLRVASIGPRS